MTLKTLRITVAAVCVVSIPGMIVSAALSHLGAVIGFGIPSAVAVFAMIVATSTVEATDLRSPPASFDRAGSISRDRIPSDTPDVVEELARSLEDHISRLVQHGAPENELRQSVAMATRLGRLLR